MTKREKSAHTLLEIFNDITAERNNLYIALRRENLSNAEKYSILAKIEDARQDLRTTVDMMHDIFGSTDIVFGLA
ncbi:hypothetical protein [Anaerosinus sp.]|uniref:hypothetical protein n=1 Tax=Selenobaculum sp. TaxID=3074374 RepID=UPI003AB6D75C